MTLEDQYAFRTKMVEYLEQDLHGPQEIHEVLEDAPLEQYVTGVLYPMKEGGRDVVEAEHDLDSEQDDADGGSPDTPVSFANRRYPSSMGVTFAVAEDVRSISVQVGAGRYEERPPEVEQNPEPRRRRIGGLGSGTRWLRIPVEPPAIELTVDMPPEDELEVEPGLNLYYRIRPADGDGSIAVTLVLINRKVVKTGLRDAYAYFQTRLTVRGTDNELPFVPRRTNDLPIEDEDVRSYRLLYRSAPTFAVGHGCSAEWESGTVANRAGVVRTTFLPKHELLLSDSNPEIAVRLSMRSFAFDGQTEALVRLRAMCDGYDSWIDETRKSAEMQFLPGTDFFKTAEANMAAATEALRRIRSGVALLEADPIVWEAFRLGNEAMLVQRARGEWFKKADGTSSPTLDDTHAWRPFQIAFILLALKGLSDPTDDERDLVDLLWFPTGGGKTEAYLGLIAFSIFLRRLRGYGGGVTALMRYTLRLLTIQQFERASLLIVACESIRKTRTDLGAQEIAIGLWVGQDATPQTRSTAKDALKKLAAKIPLESGSPVQVHRCSWCGAALSHVNYRVSDSLARLVVACGKSECAFGEGLPVFLVDQDIYEHRPALLISTVDKFASLPWREEVGSLFNLDTGQPPPDLIVQDELHLISGPLGTLTGLYETAINLLASSAGRPPKVIASTATIRRASAQSLGLFARSVRQFPPLGIDMKSSYFAVEMSAGEKAARLYVGVSAPGTSQTMLLIRTYAALLQAAQDTDGDASSRDPYWTLVGYFNSLRVLGAATIQVEDDVRGRLELLAARAKTVRRPINEQIELTSRESSSSINERLQHMDVAYPSERALDVILATNMISVGVDIDRLGLMVVMGQPQSTAEYIQATSRVGRRYPGLVVTMLNAAKSRDRSHYESFVSYHSALYRQVESSSVTPFSARSRDRGLHAVLIGLARLTIPEASPNAAAKNIVSFRHKLGPIIDTIVSRVALVAPEEATSTRVQLEDVVERWVELAEEPGGLVYRGSRKGNVPALLQDASNLEEVGLPTMWSLRDVDTETKLYLE